MSTKSSIAYIETGEPDHLASCHIYTECFDLENNVYIESWIQGEKDTYCESIVIRKDVWEAILDELKGGEE